MKRVVLFLSIGGVLLLALSFASVKNLKGVWEFKGGIYNGKKENAPDTYSLHRKYDKQHYEAFLIEKDAAPQKYEAGDYLLKGDTCIETETYSSQPSKITGIAIRYLYTIRNDTLILRGTLPSGMVVEEYWRKIK